MRNPPNEVVGLTVENAMARLLTAATEIWKTDPHDFSKRPCDTCWLLSKIVGEDWGCVKMRKQG
jgi:hypothetical protein